MKEIFAGILIAISGATYLKTGNPILFSFGLLAIKQLNLNLFTGKICISNKNAIINLFGNAIGAGIVGIALGLNEDFYKLASNACQRFNNLTIKHYTTLFIFAMLCNVCIYVAVKTNALITIFAVTCFVACGFEHCIADIFYMSTARYYSPVIFIIILGNAIGGILIREFDNKRLSKNAKNEI